MARLIASAISAPAIIFPAVDRIVPPMDFKPAPNLEVVFVASIVLDLKSSIVIVPDFTDFAISITEESTFFILFATPSISTF